MSQCRQRKYVYVEEGWESCGEYESASSDSEKECERTAQRQSSSRISSGMGGGSQVAGGASESAAFGNSVSVKKVVGGGSAAFGNSVSVKKVVGGGSSVATGGGERQQKHSKGGGAGGNCGCGGVGTGGGGSDGGGVGYNYQQQQEYNSHKASGARYNKQQQHNSYKANGNQRLHELHNYQQQQYNSYMPSDPSTYQGFEELPALRTAQHYSVGHKTGAKHPKNPKMDATSGYDYDSGLLDQQSNRNSSNYASYNNYYENNGQRLCEIDSMVAPTFSSNHYSVGHKIAGAKHPKNPKMDATSGYDYNSGLLGQQSNRNSSNYASYNNYYESNGQRLCEIDSMVAPTFPSNHDPHMATIEEACISYFGNIKIYDDDCK